MLKVYTLIAKLLCMEKDKQNNSKYRLSDGQSKPQLGTQAGNFFYSHT